MQTDTRPKPEPLHIRKERQAVEGKAAWTQYRAEQDAVNRNMERLRALRLARERLVEGFFPLFAFLRSRFACSFVSSEEPSDGGNSTPARRAFASPIAIACFVERAPCLPSRICSISSLTNSPA